ncbi:MULTISPECIES: thrombospondin type 3 repeat-containing protein [unclassified Agarivorans]|uniref:thrombospondin type 3 repeat-containing protein n=1 Tax=unclassified Agarivorans TaxID=2636026 RepID=UPI003D7F1399
MRISSLSSIAVAALFGLSIPAFAANDTYALDSGQLRFGSGAETSITASGVLKQPFYYDDANSTWYKLTYSSYPLSSAIGFGGDGSEIWNVNGTITQDPTLSNQTIDSSAFTLYDGVKGYGTLTTSGSLAIDEANLGYQASFTVEQDSPYVSITISLSNLGTSNVENLRFWMGTRDDYVGTDDSPTKTRGNLVDGVFTPISTSAEQAQGLQIESNSGSSTSGVLFYVNADNGYVIHSVSRGFERVTAQDPRTSAITATGDDAYGFYLRMKDLAPGETDSFTWYYAAGDSSELQALAQTIYDAAQGKDVVENVPVAFEDEDFVDAQGNVVSKIRIASLPEHGELTLNGATISEALEINSADYNLISYAPDEDFVGTDQFTWQAWNSSNSAYSSDISTVTFTILSDSDGDGSADVADEDIDGDGVLNEDDAFPEDPTESVDTDGDAIGNNADTDDDGDGVADSTDAFPLDAAESVDTDGDGTGNNADTDDDGDGVLDADDAFPLDVGESVDTDGDGTGNNADTDDDGDGVLDVDDAFPLDAAESVDTDGDGTGNNADTDDDGDGVADTGDAFPLDGSEIIDTDGDGTGNNADTDDDGDGVADSTDAFPLDAGESTDTDGDGMGNNADTDDDNDGVADSTDAFPLDAAETVDTDGDGIGNNADTDDDGDRVADASDAFPLDAAETVDTDGDGIGNNADTDDDNDNVLDADDAFPLDAAESVDTDGDGIGNNADTDDDNDNVLDADDAFPLDVSESVDTDGDGIGNNADTDDDGDGVADSTDAFPLDAAESVDTDGDGIGNNADTDDDGDGVADSTDVFPLDAAESVDTDGDGIGNNADTDDDGDGVADSTDAFPLDAAESVDTDGDGIGNNADTDDDGDGVLDADDVFPLDATESVDTDGDGTGNNADTDDDGDGVLDADDAFPLDAGESVDTDGDGTGNNADTDDDGDGMSDEWELANGLDPLDSADAALDSDGDGESNLEEFTKGSDPLRDTVAPVITLDPELWFNATGLFTQLELTAVSATDHLDGEIAVEMVAGQTLLEPGVHTLTYRASDAAGNIAEVNQTVNVRPLINFTKDQTIFEGDSVTVGVVLNGESPVYPLTIPYVVSGTASNGLDYVLEDGNFVIESGKQAQISFDSLNDSIADDAETIELSLLGDSAELNMGNRTSHLVTISEENIAPEAKFAIRQNEKLRAVIAQDQGMVSIQVQVSDANATDTHTMVWDLPDSLTGLAPEGDTLSVDPSDLAAGVYTIAVVVTDSGSPSLSDSVQTSFTVTSILPALSNSVDSDQDGLSDFEEGYQDTDQDGIYDYLDNQNLSSNVVGHLISEGSYNLLESDPGTSLRLGQGALQDGREGTLVEENDMYSDTQSLDSDVVTHVGGIFDFEVHNIPEHGQSVNVVIPQRAQIPENAVYRKWSPEGGWRTYVEDANNLISSAPGSEGYCPPPGDPAFEVGLVSGYWCIQLTIEDGGPNDDDATANGSIVDPSGMATRQPITEGVSASGGGSFGGVAGLLLVVLVMVRRRFS